MSQKYIFTTVDVIQDHRLTLIQTRILLAIFSFRDETTNLIFPKRKTLAERAGYSEAIISRTTTQLVELGWLEKIGKGGRSSPCKYKILNPFHPKQTVTESVTVTEPVTVTDPDPKTVTDPVRGKELTNELNKKKSKKEKFDPLKLPLPDWLPYLLWEAFVEHRKEIKKPLTERGAKLICSELKKFHSQGMDIPEIVKRSIMNNWAGVFAYEINQSNGKQSLGNIQDKLRQKAQGHTDGRTIDGECMAEAGEYFG